MNDVILHSGSTKKLAQGFLLRMDDCHKRKTMMEINRRNYLTGAATGAAALAASAVALPAQADEGKNAGDTMYGHGMVWNRNLPGVLGDLRLSFDLRLDLDTGTGLGTAGDPVHMDWGFHFAIESIHQEKRPKGEDRFTLAGTVTEANNPHNVGLPIRMIAETVGDTTAVAIRIGENAFAGAGLIILPTLRELIKLILGF